LGTTAEVLQTATAGNVYKGSAFATFGGNSYLYAANFETGTIDVLKGTAAAPNLSGSFTDPNLPAGFAPFNVQNLGGRLYVTYAKQDPNSNDELAGAGLGFVDAFDLNGNLIARIAGGGPLNAPWGLAIAPSSFGALADALLVGNFGDGTINAYDLATDALLGPLLGESGQALVIDGLWGLAVGNGGGAGSASALYFSAGPDGEKHGLFGVLTVVPEPPSGLLVAAALAAGTVARRRRRAA
jgi:uncharacterized protein (TIGR03118 family)